MRSAIHPKHGYYEDDQNYHFSICWPPLNRRSKDYYYKSAISIWQVGSTVIVQSPHTSMSVSPNALAHALKYIRRVLHHERHHQKLVRHYGHPSHLKRRCAAKVTPRDPIAGPPEAHLINLFSDRARHIPV